MTTGRHAGTWAYAADEVIAGVEKLRFFPQAVVRGEGTRVELADGRRALDFSADWTASGFGHGNLAVVRAVGEALIAGAGASVLSGTHPWATRLADALLEFTPGRGGPRRVYLGHAGTDANDVAVRGARQATGRPGLVAFELGYHGGFGGSQAFSGVHVAAGARPDPGTVFVPYPDPFRPFTGSPGTVLAASLGRVEDQLRGRRVAAVIVEPVQSDGGVIVPPDGFLAGLRDLCDRYGSLLIVDEVKVGLGRTGTPHAYDHDGVVPDLVTYGKALGGGLPLSAVVGPAEALDAPAASALMTTVGNPASCAAGLAILELVREGTTTANAADRGRQLRDLLQGYRSSGRPGASLVGDVRGRGLSNGLEIVDPDADGGGPGSPGSLGGLGGPGGPADQLAARVAYRAWQLGVIAYPVRGNVLELTPPLQVSAAEIDEGAGVLAAAVDDVARGAVTPEEIAPYTGW